MESQLGSVGIDLGESEAPTVENIPEESAEEDKLNLIQFILKKKKLV